MQTNPLAETFGASFDVAPADDGGSTGKASRIDGRALLGWLIDERCYLRRYVPENIYQARNAKGVRTEIRSTEGHRPSRDALIKALRMLRFAYPLEHVVPRTKPLDVEQRGNREAGARVIGELKIGLKALRRGGIGVQESLAGMFDLPVTEDSVAVQAEERVAQGAPMSTAWGNATTQLRERVSADRYVIKTAADTLACLTPSRYPLGAALVEEILRGLCEAAERERDILIVRPDAGYRTDPAVRAALQLDALAQEALFLARCPDEQREQCQPIEGHLLTAGLGLSPAWRLHGRGSNATLTRASDPDIPDGKRETLRFSVSACRRQLVAVGRTHLNGLDGEIGRAARAFGHILEVCGVEAYLEAEHNDTAPDPP